ncbi:hypothetical protein [Cohnella silvisoli]|uniref:Uncharacterized protein n=1 Tax=Cohnella silvisoli TaxID=2873699 RepID=A0ABV1KZU1_9BACL|nr:hypothetical protein [Cohnella silvisoli]MCD9024949.1 hypothetical protein [Cohnella silvisoli]
MPLLKISDSISYSEGNEPPDYWVEQLAKDIVMGLDSNELKELIQSLEIIYTSIVRTYH